jgi:dihydroorotase
MTSELLQQVRLLDPVSETDRIADVLLADGVVKSIADRLSDYPAETQVRDCQGLVLAPGLVDLYSHSGEPGFEERETLSSLLQAAAAGGFTRVAILPDTKPAIDNPAGVTWLRSRYQQMSGGVGEQGSEGVARPIPNLYCWGALTHGANSQQMTELAELAAAGVVGFADGQPINNPALLRRLLEYLRPIDRPVALWCYDRDLAGNGVMREGNDSVRFGLPGISLITETSALAAALECVEVIGTPVHFMRISSARSVELIRAAKNRGLPVTASTTWMHVILTSTDLGSYDPSLHLEPALGNTADRTALIQGLQDGTLDAIAIDHTPYTYEEKTVAFAESPPGAIGLELALPLLWQNLVKTGTWSALELWRVLSTHPAQCLKQVSSKIAPGEPIEAILFDPQKQWKVATPTLKSLATNTHWLEQELTGQVVQIWLPNSGIVV